MIPTHKSSSEMIDMLVSYMKEDKAIQDAVHVEFGIKPTLGRIASARRGYKSRAEKFKTEKWDKGGNGEKDRLFLESIRVGSQNLRERIIGHHPKIMRALEARGNMVVWHG